MAQGLFNSSIGRKFAMALSALFLVVFLIVHLLVNMLSVISPDAFNEASHFMGTNPIVQFLFQPILIAGVVFHFVLGFVLEVKNVSARGPVKYVKNNSAQNSTWMSRNMIVTGAMILLFIALHFGDFWVHEIQTKYISGDMSGMIDGEFRYFEELQHKFHDTWRVVVYVIAFGLLSLHLMHGFQSAFQSMGANHKRYNGLIQTLGKIYSVIIPLGFIFIAIYHYLNQ